MWRLHHELICTLLTLLPFGLVFVGALIAVLCKAFGKFPFRPDESEVFRNYSLPRAHLRCFQFFDRHKPEPKPARHRRT